jgi:FkbH-like protein
VEAIFNRRPEMLLKREDFTVVKVNWRDKSGNIEEIARELDISTESVAFIDNSPVERRLVRAGLSQVFTPELPVPRDYAAFLTALAVDFLPTGETAEDGARADLYMTRAAAAKMIDAKGGREAGIRSLELRGEIATDPRDLVARIAQITQRTNQFNLTTHRYEKGEIEKFLNDPNYRIYTLRLDSKVGDYGVIGLVILRKNGETAWEIDTFCLSCRILPMQLEVEQALLAHIVAKLKQQGAKFLIGKYVPTQKNIIVRELFRRLGFDKVTEEENGTTTWQLDLTQRTITGTSLIKFV